MGLEGTGAAIRIPAAFQPRLALSTSRAQRTRGGIAIHVLLPQDLVRRLAQHQRCLALARQHHMQGAGAQVGQACMGEGGQHGSDVVQRVART